MDPVDEQRALPADELKAAIDQITSNSAEQEGFWPLPEPLPYIM